MDCSRFVLCIIGIAISASVTDSAISTKVWRGNTDFNDPKNWRPPHIPCSNTRVIFDIAHDFLVMMLPTRTNIKELILPYNGEIVFPTNGALMLKSTNSITSYCKNEDVFYVGTTLSAWMNPRSWDWEGEISYALAPSPVPHAEQIPCEHDKVVFPPKGNFRVILPRVATAVGSLSIEGQALDIEEWRTMAESVVGRLQFIGDPFVINVLGDDGADHPCTDPTGCYCGNGGPKTMERVCSYAGGSQCGIPLCLQPIHPIGHCCDICGASIQLEYIPHTFKMSALKNHLQRFSSPAVLRHVGKISATTNQVQIVFVDAGTYDGESVGIAKRLLRVIQNDMSLGVQDIKFHGSGPAIDLSEMYISRSPEKIVGFIFGAFALLVLAFLLFLAYRDRFTRSEAPSFVFSRFENMSSRREAPVIRVWGEVAEEAHEGKQFDKPQEQSDWVTMESVVAPSKPQAFDNPMYNKPIKDDGGKKTEATKHSEAYKEGKHGGPSIITTTMENPMYSALKASEEGEKQAKSDSEEKRELPPPIITKRKARPKTPKKGKVKRELLSEEDTDGSTGSDNKTTVEDFD